MTWLRGRFRRDPRLLVAMVVAVVGLTVALASSVLAARVDTRVTPEVGCVIGATFYQVDTVARADVPDHLLWIHGECGELLDIDWLRAPEGPEAIITWRGSAYD